ncbi:MULTISPECIES: hypothetical protein [Gordonia]|uniref:Uncharacterized protein n=1 Tax=Gordonia jacobaea TaxID=122202 RepID=A0ABR5IB49_9ACTN|nr:MULTISPECIES: hypothetical protein [Gordonia]KNA90917.1 hypothetical protein ABW18_11285 [Gordonia jacobaea]OBA57719.1 hypothetical protein A5777_06790 [Gordonia sp. 852002-10350_SCH5691597]
MTDHNATDTAGSDSTYASELHYLVKYAEADWVGFSPIVGAAASLTKHNYSREKLNATILQLVSDLLDNGASAGDLTASETTPFAPWQLSRDEVLQHIRREIDELPDFPVSGEICFFTVVEARREA